MANNENLCPPWKKGESGNPNGRPRNRVKKDWLPKLFGRKRAKELKKLTQEEIDCIETLALVETSAELQTIIKWDGSPSYAKNIAMAILSDTKNGRTNTIDKLRERQYGTTPTRYELTGANGEPLNPQPIAVEIIDRREQVERNNNEPNNEEGAQ